MRFKLRLLFPSLLIGILAVLLTPHNAHALSCTVTPSPAPSGSPAFLRVNFQDSSGNPINATYTLTDVCAGSDSIVNTDPKGTVGTHNSNSTNSITRTSTGGTDYYAYSTSGGNGIYLDCRQLQGPSAPHGNNGKTSVFNININARAGGTWSATNDFNVSNGGTTPLTYTWTPTPPPPPTPTPAPTTATLDGIKVDSAGATLSASTSPGNGTVTVSSTSPSTDTSNPFYFNGGSGNGGKVPAGTRTLSVTAPAGYTVGYKICDACTGPQINALAATAGSSFNYTFTAGGVYHMRWIFTPVAATANLDGIKVDPSGATLSASASPGNATVTVDGLDPQTPNPFYYSGAAGNGSAISASAAGISHSIAVTVPAGYTVSYQTCDGCAAINVASGNTAGSSFNLTFITGHNYHMRWIFTLVPTTATLDGYKIDEYGGALSASSSPGNLAVTASGVGSDSANPFYFDSAYPGHQPSLPAGSHTISVPAIFGYNIYYKLCDAANASCNLADLSTGFSPGTSYTFNFAAGSKYQSRWMFVLINTADCVSATSSKNPMAVGDTTNLSVTFRNSGGAIWTPGSYSFHEVNGNIAFPPLLVNPGESVTFNYSRTPGFANASYAFGGNISASGVDISSYCGSTIDVQTTYNYQPDLQAPGGTTSDPAGSVNPGYSVNLIASTRNICGAPQCFAPGAVYSGTITGYYAAPNDASRTSLGTVFSANYSSAPGLAPGGSASNLAATYIIPSTAPDGTQYCFYHTVSPGQNINLYDGSQPDVGEGSHVSATYCYEVIRSRSALIQSQQGDVHAGGGIGRGCSLTGNGDLKTTSGSYGEYIASAAGGISGFGSANSPSGTNLTFSNNGVYGSYGVICRPDLAAVAEAYPGKGISGNSVDVTNLSNGLWYHNGPLTIVGGTINPGNRVTVYNVGNVTITGDIRISNTPVSVTNLPSFGLITGAGGNLLISKDVQTLHGFYNTSGYIDTCYQHVSNNTGDCPNVLSVLGSLVGQKIYFWRTGATGTYQGQSVVTENVRQSGLLYLAPPPAFETQLNSSFAQPKYQGERPPLY